MLLLLLLLLRLRLLLLLLRLRLLLLRYRHRLRRARRIHRLGRLRLDAARRRLAEAPTAQLAGGRRCPSQRLELHDEGFPLLRPFPTLRLDPRCLDEGAAVSDGSAQQRGGLREIA